MLEVLAQSTDTGKGVLAQSADTGKGALAQSTDTGKGGLAQSTVQYIRRVETGPLLLNLYAKCNTNPLTGF